MAVIVREGRFSTADETVFAQPGEGAATRIELPGDADPALVADRLDALEAIRIVLPVFSDGRGLTLAARLRQAGYRDTLRAAGPLLADQYPMALRCGFDEIEITDEHAERIPEAQWLDAMARTNLNYQDQLRTRVAIRKAA